MTLIANKESCQRVQEKQMDDLSPMISEKTRGKKRFPLISKLNIIMRKIVRAAKVIIKPYPIIRFDNQEHTQNLILPVSNRRLQFSRSIVSQHSDILKASAAEANTVCLASNQIGLESEIIAISSKIIQHQGKSLSWINSDYNKAHNYTIYHKPRIIYANNLIQSQQESISFPFLKFNLQRYNNLTVNYLGSNNSTVEQEIQGMEALAFQQSQQQLQGDILLDWRINEGNIAFNQQASQYFPKTTAAIKEYVGDIKKIFKQYPQLIKKPQQYILNQDKEVSESKDYLPFQIDFYKRLFRYYSREMAALEEHLAQNTPEYIWNQSIKPDIYKIDK